MKISYTQPQPQPISKETLIRENLQYIGTGGVSENNRSQGFAPAFLDTNTGNIYRSLFPNGRPAPVHILSCLPAALFDIDDSSNEHHPIKNSVVSGFVLDETFYTREEAASALDNMH